jgi:hypothetical protein
MFRIRWCTFPSGSCACNINKCAVCIRLASESDQRRLACQASTPSKDTVRSEGPDVDDLVERAEAALNKARAALDEQRNTNTTDVDNTATPSFIPTSLTFGAPLRLIPGTRKEPDKLLSRQSISQGQKASQDRIVRFESTRTPDLQSAGRSPARATKTSTQAPVGTNAGEVKADIADAGGGGAGLQTRPNEAPPMHLQRSRAATRRVVQEFAEALPDELVLISQVQCYLCTPMWRYYAL